MPPAADIPKLKGLTAILTPVKLVVIFTAISAAMPITMLNSALLKGLSTPATISIIVRENTIPIDKAPISQFGNAQTPPIKF